MSTELEVSPFCLWADFGVSCAGSSAASAWELGVRLELDLQSVYQVSSGLVLNIGKWLRVPVKMRHICIYTSVINLKI